MSSTFTANHSIEKPLPGTQKGVWGPTANRNYDKIDAALGKVITLNAVTNPVLSTSESAVADFDSAVIRFTGNISSTGNRTATLPSGKSGVFIVDKTAMTFGSNKLIIRVAGELGGVTIVSTSQNCIHVYSNGVSTRRVGIDSSGPILGEVRMYAPPGGFVSAGVLPVGWFLADGSNGTVDLRDRFLKCYSSNPSSELGQTGGQNSVSVVIPGGVFSGTTDGHALTQDQLPPHSHNTFANVTDTSPDSGPAQIPPGTYAAAALQSASNSLNYAIQGVASPVPTVGPTSNTGAGQAHTHGFSVTGSGSTTTINTRPKYYTVIFIQYLGAP